MEEWQKRVVDEKDLLDIKITGLNTFIKASPLYQAMPRHMQILLRLQRVAMTQYSDILAERIAAFGT